MGLRVQKTACETCVYRPESPINPLELEESIREKVRGQEIDFFTGFRICHLSKTACCAGFWVKNKDKFQMGQLAQRLNLVEFVQDNIPTRISKSVKRSWRKRDKT
jgi:hypothetical protein